MKITDLKKEIHNISKYLFTIVENYNFINDIALGIYYII